MVNGSFKKKKKKGEGEQKLWVPILSTLRASQLNVASSNDLTQAKPLLGHLEVSIAHPDGLEQVEALHGKHVAASSRSMTLIIMCYVMLVLTLT